MNKFTKVLLSLPLLLGTVACSDSSFTVKGSEGYTFNFQEENITTEIVQETKFEMTKYSKYGMLEEMWATIKPANDVYVTANGTAVDLTGKEYHFSEKVLCKTEAHIKHGKSPENPGSVWLVFDGRQMEVSDQYHNENSVVCQAARHYNLI